MVEMVEQKNSKDVKNTLQNCILAIAIVTNNNITTAAMKRGLLAFLQHGRNV